MPGRRLPFGDEHFDPSPASFCSTNLPPEVPPGRFDENSALLLRPGWRCPVVLRSDSAARPVTSPLRLRWLEYVPRLPFTNLFTRRLLEEDLDRLWIPGFHPRKSAGPSRLIFESAELTGATREGHLKARCRVTRLASGPRVGNRMFLLCGLGVPTEYGGSKDVSLGHRNASP